MAIDVQRLKSWPFGEVEHTYTERDSALYALALGYGADPLDERALRYVYGPELQAAPSMASVLGFPGQWMRDSRSGIDWMQVVHGEQRTRLHRPLPAAASVRARTRVKSIIDKGAGKGALVLMSRDIVDTASGTLLATVEQLNFCRGDGGFSASGQRSDEVPAPAPPMPQREADCVCDIETRPETALLYRLCGDMNPLHADPAVARAAGFARPILHGLATYGIAAHALLKMVVDHDSARLRSLEARFSAPVYPGETLRTEIWREGNGAVFRTKALERDVIVLNHGRADLA